MGFDYIFGKLANRPELPEITWNPDARESINPHLLMCAASGAGKTTLLKKIAKYLTLAKKHIYIFDLKGDMIILDDDGNRMGNYIEFTAWNSQYGINPFEFDTGVIDDELKEIVSSGVMSDEQRFKVQNSGPKVQVERIIEIIKKNFLPNMGTNQKDILMYLLSDTYLSKDFKYDDVKTWLNELPSLKDTQELIERIKSNNMSGSGTVIDGESISLIMSVQSDITGIKSLQERLSDADDAVEVENLIGTLKRKMHDSLDSYIEFGLKNYTAKNTSANKEWFEARNINIDKYASKEAIRTIEKMSSYINALVDSGVFHSVRPPVKNGLNVINISGLDVSIQRFIVDVWLGKVFKSCKIRGTYSERTNKTRGEKCDTYVIVDESKLIAGTSRDKNDPYSYLNRTATEARGFGFGIIVAAQSAEHFPPEFLKNFDAQIILNTGIADFDTVRKSFGIDKQLLEFTQHGFGNALVKTGRSFSKVKLNVT
ncbi:MAG: ATP-binding protein [Sulfurimonas sp.]|jgi:DNA helicase HerA-like ATPase